MICFQHNTRHTLHSSPSSPKSNIYSLLIISQEGCFVKSAIVILCKQFLYDHQNYHVRRIVDIEEPAVQILVPNIATLSVIHRDRYEREKSTILKKRAERYSLSSSCFGSCFAECFQQSRHIENRHQSVIIIIRLSNQNLVYFFLSQCCIL